MRDGEDKARLTMVQRNCEREERWRVREKEREGGKGRER